MRRSAALNMRGMTLVEVMVALAVVAISLMAASRAFSQWVNGSQSLHERMLASICAQNTLTQWQLSRTLPTIGTFNAPCTQDGLVFQVQTEVNTTPNLRFRRAQINVFGPMSKDVALFHITTAIAKP